MNKKINIHNVKPIDEKYLDLEIKTTDISGNIFSTTIKEYNNGKISPYETEEGGAIIIYSDDKTTKYIVLESCDIVIYDTTNPKKPFLELHISADHKTMRKWYSDSEHDEDEVEYGFPSEIKVITDFLSSEIAIQKQKYENLKTKISKMGIKIKKGQKYINSTEEIIFIDDKGNEFLSTAKDILNDNFSLQQKTNIIESEIFLKI